MLLNTFLNPSSPFQKHQGVPIPEYYIQVLDDRTQSGIAYKNKAAKPPATAAKLIPTVAAPALEAVGAPEPEEVAVPEVELAPADPEEEAVEFGTKVELATIGSPMVVLYMEQEELTASGQVISVQMDSSCMP